MRDPALFLESNEIEELGTKETKELIRRLVLLQSVETTEIEHNGRFVDRGHGACIDGAQIKRSWRGKSGVLFTYAPRCFMIIYGPDEYARRRRRGN